MKERMKENASCFHIILKFGFSLTSQCSLVLLSFFFNNPLIGHFYHTLILYVLPRRSKCDETRILGKENRRLEKCCRSSVI